MIAVNCKLVCEISHRLSRQETFSASSSGLGAPRYTPGIYAFPYVFPIQQG